MRLSLLSSSSSSRPFSISSSSATTTRLFITVLPLLANSALALARVAQPVDANTIERRQDEGQSVEKNFGLSRGFVKKRQDGNDDDVDSPAVNSGPEKNYGLSRGFIKREDVDEEDEEESNPTTTPASTSSAPSDVEANYGPARPWKRDDTSSSSSSSADVEKNWAGYRGFKRDGEGEEQTTSSDSNGDGVEANWAGYRGFKRGGILDVLAPPPTSTTTTPSTTTVAPTTTTTAGPSGVEGNYGLRAWRRDEPITLTTTTEHNSNIDLNARGMHRKLRVRQEESSEAGQPSAVGDGTEGNWPGMGGRGWVKERRR